MNCKFNSKSLKRIVSLMAVLAGVIYVFGFGCGRPNMADAPTTVQRTDHASTVTSGDLGSDDDSTVRQFKPDTATAGVPILSQTYASFLSVLDLDPSKLSAATRVEYERVAGNFSHNGQMNSIGSAYQLALASLAAQLCVDKMRAEAPNGAARTIFKDISFGAAPPISDEKLAGVIKRLARAAWQRDETEAERSALISAVKDSLAVDTSTGNLAGTAINAKTKNAMMFLCTAMLVSTSGVAH